MAYKNPARCSHMKLPMAALFGCRDAKQALMLLAVEPRLKGVIISSGPGTSKSLLARSFETILPSSYTRKGCSLVEVPLNVSEDMLLGGIDIEQALATGRREAAPGLLARANGRALYVDEINLFETSAITHLAAALDSGVERLEREGISAVLPSEFLLIATFDPGEGELSPVIMERVGLLVNQPRENDAERRAEIADRALRFDEGPSDWLEEFENETALIRRAVEDARARLPKVRVSPETIRELSRSAIELGVRGNRADIFALRAAVASAALAGRTSVEDEDTLQAIRFVLMPRATSSPDTGERDECDAQRESRRAPDRGEPVSTSNSVETGSGSGFRDLLLKPVESPGSLDLPAFSLRRSSRPSSGKRIPSPSMSGGRYVSSTQSRGSGVRLAIDATLRAAAPRQANRKMKRPAGKGTHVNNRPIIEADDLRFKVLKRRSGALIIFAVDASGSMAVNRVAQAKGAMTRLLEKAYLHRDRVAFISFRGDEANVLLQPTRSVVLGKRLVEAMPAGGATPLAKGLIAALDLARRARMQEKTESLLLIFTDGRANVGLRTGHLTDRVEREAEIKNELERIGTVMQAECVHPVVIDTRSRYVSSGESRALADWICARYLYLPRADAVSISESVAELSGRLRR